MNPGACSICQTQGHHARACPELSAPLRPGFFAPSGGGGHSHDDDDEKAQQFPHNVLQIPKKIKIII